MSNQLYTLRRMLSLALFVGLVAGVTGAVGVVVGMRMTTAQVATDDQASIQTSMAAEWRQVTKLMASASATGEGFSMATGAVDEDVEGLFILDHLTGDLRGLLLNVRTGKFNSFYQYNVVKDLGTANVKNPKYVMLTGGAAFRDGIGSPRARLSRSAIYVAELDSGVVAAYAVPWAPGHQQFGRTTNTSFVALDRSKFRDIPIRDQ